MAGLLTQQRLQTGPQPRAGRQRARSPRQGHRRREDRREHHAVERDLGLTRHLGRNARQQRRQRGPRERRVPTSDPVAASTACSTINWRRICRATRRCAVRTASSRARSIDRPRTSVPRLTAPSSRMRPTATSSRSSAGRTWPVRASCSAATRIVRPQSAGRASAGASRDERRQLVAMRTRPWPRRAAARLPWRTWCVDVACPARTGAAPTGRRRPPKSSKPAGITPITSYGA